MKKIYIPGFGNTKDKVYKNIVGGNATIVQDNLYRVSKEMARRFVGENLYLSDIKSYLSSKTKTSQLFTYLSHKFRHLTFDPLHDLINQTERIDDIVVTRTINSTMNKTYRDISHAIKDESFEVFGHSQGGLLTMLLFLDHPELLEKCHSISLLAPVLTGIVGAGFHRGKEGGYVIPRKKVFVSPTYINSLLKLDQNIFDRFLQQLDDQKWKGELKIWLGGNDTVIDFESTKKMLADHNKKHLYDVKIVENGDHYLSE